MWLQEKIQLELRNQDFHLIIEEVLGNQPELKSTKQGLARFHSQYTSASLSKMKAPIAPFVNTWDLILIS